MNLVFRGIKIVEQALGVYGPARPGNGDKNSQSKLCIQALLVLTCKEAERKQYAFFD